MAVDVLFYISTLIPIVLNGYLSPSDCEILRIEKKGILTFTPAEYAGHVCRGGSSAASTRDGNRSTSSTRLSDTKPASGFIK